MYNTWNQRLFNHFFNEANADSPVITYVDKGLLDGLGKDIGGFDAFVESIVFVDGQPQHLVRRLRSLVCSDESCSICSNNVPPFFGVLCLVILAWTVDPELHSGNYYDRLNGILQKAYEKFGFSIDSYEIGKRKNQRLSAEFRLLLDKSFKLLEFHTKEKLNANMGFYDFRKLGIRPIDIARAQALINAKDKARLEFFFFEQGVRPEDELSMAETRRLLDPAVLHIDYLRQVTINCWKNTYENQDIICEIVISLIRYWNGTYEENAPLTNKQEGDRPKRSGAYLWPVFRSQGIVGGFELGMRIEFTNQDFPITPISLKDAFASYNKIHRQHGGWSQFFSVSEENLEFLLTSPETKVLRSSDGSDVRFFPKPICIFEKAPHLGGYTPVRDVSLGIPYLIFLNEKKAKPFFEANRENLRELPYSSKVHGWSLYVAKEGLFSFDGLEKIRIRSRSKVLELFGGAKIGHGASRKFSAVVPPQVRLRAQLPEGCQVICQHGLNEIRLIDLEDTCFAIPEKKLEAGMYEFSIKDCKGDRVSGFDLVNFWLVPCSMPGKGDMQHVLLDDTSTFLYNYEEIGLDLQGWEKAAGRDIFLRPKDNTPLFVEFSPQLNDLTLLCDWTMLSSYNGQYILPQLEDGNHKIIALWHGVEIGEKEFCVTQQPVITVKVVGATNLQRDDNSWLTHASAEVELCIVIEQQDGLPVSIFLDVEKRSIKSGTIVIPLCVNNSNKLQLRWAGKILLENRYNLISLPEILVELDNNSGKKWKGSQIYKPENPPVFQVMLEPNEYLALKNMQFFWGDVQLLLEEEDEYVAELSFPKDPSCASYNTEKRLSVQIYGDRLTFDTFPKIMIQDKPDFDINIIGQKSTQDIYWQNLSNKIYLSANISNVKVLVNEREVKPNSEGEYPFPPATISKDMADKDILIKVYWWDELVKERTIQLTRKRVRNITFIGGRNLVKQGNGIYPLDACPTKIRIEGQGAEGQLTVMFGQYGTDLVSLVPDREGLFSLGLYDVTSDTKYVVEILQSDDIPVQRAQFSTADSDWLKIGYYDGQVDQLNENVNWPICWIIKKNGKKPMSIQRAFSCLKDQCTCPCDDVLQLNKPVALNNKDKKRWKKLINQSHTGMSQDDQKCWNAFVSGVRE